LFIEIAYCSRTLFVLLLSEISREKRKGKILSFWKNNWASNCEKSIKKRLSKFLYSSRSHETDNLKQYSGTRLYLHPLPHKVPESIIHWTSIRRGRSSFASTYSSELRDQNKGRTNAPVGMNINKVASMSLPPRARRP